MKPDEVHALLDAARGDRFEAVLTVAIAVGLRRGEALGLKWSDIDLDNAVLRVRRALVYVDGDLRFVDPKTKHSRRTITLPSVSIHALRDHRRWQAAQRLAAGPAWEDDDLVFPSATGGPMDQPRSPPPCPVRPCRHRPRTTARLCRPPRYADVGVKSLRT